MHILQEHEETKTELAKQKEELAAVKKESHKRKKLLIAQQQLIHAGSGSYNKVSNWYNKYPKISYTCLSIGLIREGIR